MDIIKLLPDSVANQIAAGEVIQRPASAVKELLENAVDAGALEITLIVKDSGKTLIQVIDNGCGMSAHDAGLCFERHATSKIREASDLFSIRTMGFRGEALASIAAIAQVELKTKRKEDELGTCIHIEGTVVKSNEACQCADGTSFSIRNLFFNVPARRNFLKSDNVEMGYIMEEFQRVALVNPSISCTLIHNGKTLYQLKTGNVKQRILAIFGTNYAHRLLDVETHTNLLKVKGFIGKPEHAKKTRGEQYFFANGRFIKHPYLHHAVEKAYQDLLPDKSFPSYFLYLDVDPKSIDVNIHPTKTEVKFEDERSLYAILRAAVRQALGKFSLIPSLDFDREDCYDFTDSKSKDDIVIPKIDINPDFNPFEKKTVSSGGFKQERAGLDQWEKLYEGLQSGDDTAAVQQLESSLDEQDAPSGSHPFFQLQGKYILTPMKSGVMIVHLQFAQERIFYERILKSIKMEKVSIQQLLFPQTVRFSVTDSAILLSILQDIRKTGFDIEDLGGGSFSVNGVPMGLEESDLQSLLERILEDFKNDLRDTSIERFTRIAAGMARQMAVRSEKVVTEEGMRSIVDLLFACETPEYTPDGKKTFSLTTYEEIEKKFK